MIAPARQVSYQILIQIEASDAHSDELLRSPEADALSPQDRNLATTLVLGTLRWQLALDERIRPLLARPDAQLSSEIAVALRMGAYQLLHLERVPAHAVLNDSVELVKRGPDARAAGMVNAVLRKVAALPRFAAPERLTTPRALAEAFAHPEWMVVRWARRYGMENATAICRRDQEPAAVAIRVVDANADLSGLELEPGALLSGARRVVGGDVGRSEALRAGQIRIQDEASQLVAEIAAAAVTNAEAVLDTCAAPGGKTAVLVERLPKAEITAVDASRKRLDAMRRLSTAWGGQLHFHAADVATLPLRPEFDLILCDVPCSGTGTMARNPEIRLRVGQPDLARQHQRQAAILRAGLAGLAPGGRLVYSTCSLEKEENEAVVAEIVAEVSGTRVVPVAPILDQLEKTQVLTPEGREKLRGATDGEFLRTLPGVHPCDGFFAAVLERA